MPLISITKSQALFAEAQKHIPGGVNSPVRAFRAVGGEPLFIERGNGSRIYDADGNSYIDYVASWGPLILGHANSQVADAINKQAELGTSFGAPCRIEIEMAKMVKDAFPSMDLVRMVNSGTEATMSALRAARGYTGRKKIVKFEGCYHGHSDSLLAKAGSGAMTFDIPDSEGVPAEITSNTITLPYNDKSAAEKLLKKQGKEIAAVIVEPIAGNMGVIPPVSGFLEALRELCTKNSIVLIFDEVITGFRVAWGGAQELYGIKADMTCLGKIIGGGLPVGAYGGKKEIMEKVSPLGGVYQAGTLSGNPLALAAGLKTLQIIKNTPAFYKGLDEKACSLARGLSDIFKKKGVPAAYNRVGSMMTNFFTKDEVVDYQSAKKASTANYEKFFKQMLASGVYFAPSQFEAAFVSFAHSWEDIEMTLKMAESAAEKLT